MPTAAPSWIVAAWRVLYPQRTLSSLILLHSPRETPWTPLDWFRRAPAALLHPNPSTRDLLRLRCHRTGVRTPHGFDCRCSAPPQWLQRCVTPTRYAMMDSLHAKLSWAVENESHRRRLTCGVAWARWVQDLPFPDEVGRSVGRSLGRSVGRSVRRRIGPSVRGRQSVGPSVSPSVRPSVRPSIRPSVRTLPYLLSIWPSCKAIYESFCNRARALAPWVLLVLVFGDHFR